MAACAIYRRRTDESVEGRSSFDRPSPDCTYLGSSAERSRDEDSICSDFSFVPSGTRNGNVQEYSGTLPTSTNVDAVLYFLPAASVTVGRFIGDALNAGATLKATVTSANCSPGRVTAFTVFVPGGQSRSDAVAARSTLVTVASRP